ncbi:OmpA family protein [Falsiroseomonas bella]|uniref:OmpA family protein n=1 Tax=Falsiroseomonas bella TaxID=2184016 RepID=A0A317FJ12_9PROT|nr:OmpA family protein [Falsiroseomonas bella]PWS38603.1 OmpA family protein [Falsiroseomonas bella]
MRAIHLPILACAVILPAAMPEAQEAATGTVQMQAPAPEPRGVTVEQGGRPLTGVVPRGAAVDITGANVVVEEGPRTTRLTVNNDVLFDFDKAELRPQAEAALRRVAEIIRQRGPRAVRIVGHTDAIGSDAYNQQLSERRARSVMGWLTAHAEGLPPVQAVGRGESDPVAPNTTPAGADNPAGRQQNRRVEVLLER